MWEKKKNHNINRIHKQKKYINVGFRLVTTSNSSGENRNSRSEGPIISLLERRLS